MPFAFDLLDEEQRKKAEQEQSQGAPEMTGGGESFGDGSGQPNPQTGSEKGTSKQGSGFVNLDKYMDANKGNNFGGQFTGKVQSTVDQAKQGLEQGANEFAQASNQGATKWNDVGDTVKGFVDNAGDNTGKDDVSKFNTYANAQYQGPESFLGTASGTKAQGGVTKASQQAGALQSEGGRFALLDQYFGRPKYNLGEKSLDNLLVQSTPGVAARASRLGGQANELSNQFGQKTQDSDNLAASNKTATLDAAKKTKDYLGNAMTGFKSDLENRYGGYLSEGEKYNKARREDLSDDNFDDDTLGLLGLAEGQNLYDIDLSNYLQERDPGSLSQFASDKDYARYLALQQLAGEDGELLTAADRPRAGSANGKLGVDESRMNADLNQRKATYEGQAAPIQQAIEATNAEYERKRGYLDRYGPPRSQGVNIDSGQAMGDPAYDALVKAVEAEKNKLFSLQNQFANLQSQFKTNRKVSKASPSSSGLIPIDDVGGVR